MIYAKIYYRIKYIKVNTLHGVKCNGRKIKQARAMVSTIRKQTSNQKGSTQEAARRPLRGDFGAKKTTQNN